jgi:hypothetical protein
VKTPFLQVVTGEGRAASPWLSFPETVDARCPANRDHTCKFRISKLDLQKAAKVGRRQPAFDMWSAVLGQAPPVPNIEAYQPNFPVNEGLTALSEASACFRGVKRPWAEDDMGDDVLAYILKPRFLYRYQVSMACTAEKVRVPEDLVFVAYVRLDEPYDVNSLLPRGVVTHGGLVETDGKDLLLPIDYATRYTARLW